MAARIKKFSRGIIDRVFCVQKLENWLEISLSLTVFEINDIFNFHQHGR